MESAPLPYWLPESERARIAPDSLRNLEGLLARARDAGTYLQLDTSGYTITESRVLLLTLLGLAQYHKDWVDHLATHKLHLVFRDTEGGELAPANWPYADGIQEWFDDFRASCPIGFFLLGQEEALQLAVAGDIIDAIPEEEARHEEDQTTYYFSAGEAQAMEERVFLQCLYFLNYCAPSGADALPHLRALLDTLGCSFSIEDVLAQWETHRAELRVSIHLEEGM